MTTRANQGRVFNFDSLEDWSTIRARYIDAFDGEMPHPTTEATIIEAFENHPSAVRRELAKLATDRAAGRPITTGWGLARKRAEQILTPPTNPTAKTGIDREKAITRAETWMWNAGMHFDDEGEIILELFDTGKILHPYAQADLVRGDNGSWHLETRGDIPLIERMVTMWEELHPISVQSEQEAQERADTWKRQQKENPWNRSTSQNSEPKPNEPHPDSTPSAKSTATTSSRSSTPPKPPAKPAPSSTASTTAPVASHPEKTSAPSTANSRPSTPDSAKPSPASPPEEPQCSPATRSSTGPASPTSPSSPPAPSRFSQDSSSNASDADPALAHDDLPL